MPILPLPQAIDRFKDNDLRLDTFMNGGDTATYTSSGSVVVPSVQKIVAGLNFSTPSPIGNTTPSTGAFTTLSATGSATFGAYATVGTSAGDVFYADSINTAVKAKSAGGGIYLQSSAGVTQAISSATGLAITGALSATGTITNTANPGTSQTAFAATTSGTGYNVMTLNNTGGQFLLGIDNSTGTPLGTNLPYASTIIAPASLVLQTNGGTKKMTLDASGNLGLGVVPSAWGSAYKASQATYGSLYSAAYSMLGLSAGGYNDNTNWLHTQSGQVASRYEQAGGAHSWYTAPSGTAGAAITFTQAMTLDAGGNLLLGLTSLTDTPSAGGFAFNANGNVASRFVVGHASGVGSGTIYANFTYNGSAIGSIYQSGTTAVVYATTSDHRLKENVRPANATRFGDIEFVDFEWVDGRHDCGVIAHQLQSVYPDLVLGAKDATEVRAVEITPAVPAVTEQVLVTPAVDAVAEVLGEDGNVTQEAVAAVEAVYETVEVTPAIPAVTEDQTFPVYQQVNYMGLIGRMGTTIQKQQSLIEAMEARLTALEQA
jgi:hypothetical protein